MPRRDCCRVNPSATVSWNGALAQGAQAPVAFSSRGKASGRIPFLMSSRATIIPHGKPPCVQFSADVADAFTPCALLAEEHATAMLPYLVSDGLVGACRD